MGSKRTKTDELIGYDQLIGSLSWGMNRPKIFLALCKVYKELNLDIIDVDSRVRRGRFAKMIISRNSNEKPVSFQQFSNKIKRASTEFDFESTCFIIPQSSESAERNANVVIVLLTENKTGLLADLLQVLDEYNIDIVDIDIMLDERTDTFALNVHTYIPVEGDSFFSVLTRVRARLGQLKEELDLQTFNFMVHSSETFDFIEKIDFEYKEA